MDTLISGWDTQCPEDSEQKNDQLNQSMSEGGECRTAPATPGLLITCFMFLFSTPFTP